MPSFLLDDTLSDWEMTKTCILVFGNFRKKP